VTFLFTDIEGSTRLWQHDEEAMRAALERHDSIVKSASDGHGGYVFSTGGDGFGVAFARAGEAVAAAVDAQAALLAEPWPEGARILVRMGLHTGEAEERDGDYFGTVVNRAARLMAVGHGGQVLCSAATADVVADAVLGLVDLGEHRLRDLDRAVRVFQVGRGGFPPLRSMESLPGNLPMQASSFVGREGELAEATEVLAGSRLVTLIGVGGVGKTRLALQLAADQLAAFPDGVWFCDLASVLDGLAVAGEVAATLGLQPAPGEDPARAVVGFAAGRRMLVVLDNCEHLLDGVAGLVDLFVRDAGPARIVATSREALGVAGERVLAVRPLGVAGEGERPEASDAVRLFVSRAGEARPGFVLTDDNAAAVVAVCRRLDGIPLALELAAARIASMGPGELAERLDQRFRLLTRGSRTARARHQTLRAAIDWSFDALDPSAQRGLASCAVFAGGFSLGAAEMVLADDDLDSLDVTDVLDELVRRSLVVVEQGASGATRYRLLETIRQYADERLDAQQAQRARRAHALWCAGFAEQAGDGLRGTDGLAWTDRLEPELENLRLAVGNASEDGDADTAMRIAGAFADWAYYTRPSLGLRIASLSEPALAVPGADEHPARSAVIAAAALHALNGGDTDRAWDLALRAAELARRDQKPPPIGAVLAAASNTGRVAQVERIVDLEPDEHTDLNDRAVAQCFRAMLHAVLLASDAVDEGRKAVELAESTGVLRYRASAHWALGVALSVDHPSEATGQLEAAIELARVGRDDFVLTHATNRLAHTTLALDPAQAAKLFHARLDEAQRLGSAQVNMWLILAAFLLAQAGRADVAASVLGALTGSVYLLNPITARDHQQAESRCREILGATEYTARHDAGRQIGTGEALQLALTALSAVAAGI